MTDSERPGGGLLASAKGLAATVIAAVHSRIELFSTELAEEREWVREMAMLMVVAAICFAFAAFLLTLLVVVAFWDTHRLLAIGAMGILYLAAGLAAVATLRDRSRNRGTPFAATLGELAKDRDALKR